MRPSVLLTAAFAVSSTAAPALLNLNVKNTVNPFNAIDSLSGYFNLIASKVQAAKVLSVAPVCDLSKAQMPNGKHELKSTTPTPRGHEKRAY